MIPLRILSQAPATIERRSANALVGAAWRDAANPQDKGAPTPMAASAHHATLAGIVGDPLLSGY
jgi:hypothetical protein